MKKQINKPDRHAEICANLNEIYRRKNADYGDSFTITDRRYIGHEDDTGYHHYAIDVAKYYILEE